MSANTPISVGLGGDGDEIEAIDDVERAFGVKLDYSDTSHWRTAGDVFDALQKALPDDESNRAEQWERFAAALCGVTGVDPKEIERTSPLLSESGFWRGLANVSAAVWVVILLALITAVAATVLTVR